MRRLLCTLALLGLIAVPASAADEKPKPNTLTAKEIAEGWILLFDGETTFGWKVDGEARVANGILEIGGAKATTVRTTAEFGDFNMKYQFLHENVGKSALTLPGLNKDVPLADAAIGNNLKGWVQGGIQLGVFVRQFRELGGSFRTLEGESLSAFKLTDPIPSKTTEIAFRAPAGSKLLIRDVKFQPQEPKPIFTGKDLTGWKEIPGRKSKFAVTDKGELNIKDGNGDIQTEGQWDDFVLQMDIISNGDHLNSGVFFRCLPGEFWSGYEAQIRNEWVTELTLRDGKKLMGSYTEKGNEVELKICEVDGKTVKVTRDVVKVPKGDITDVKHRRDLPIDFGTGGVYNRQPARRVVSTDREWFTMTVIAHGNHIATWVNGYQVADFTDDRPMDKSARKGTKLDKGPISLQGHDPTTDLSFRNIRVAELPRAEKK